MKNVLLGNMDRLVFKAAKDMATAGKAAAHETQRLEVAMAAWKREKLAEAHTRQAETQRLLEDLEAVL